MLLGLVRSLYCHKQSIWSLDVCGQRKPTKINAQDPATDMQSTLRPRRRVITSGFDFVLKWLVGTHGHFICFLYIIMLDFCSYIF